MKRIGTELVPQVKLEKWQIDEAAERLSKPKERKEEANRKAKAVQLKYEFDKSLRGGKGGYKETLVPAKKVTAQAKQDYMVSLAARCQETSQKTKAALKEKYLQPLNPNAKKIAAGMPCNLTCWNELCDWQLQDC
ncbi:hypothetical protein WJX73_001722 [Symbiochloris irregularis]|uniref:Uncharacterized protein n=1 Tax=Symbiochloris irregularis TaxID=706552 RepID=A0AAW1NL85_9CHLO